MPPEQIIRDAATLILVDHAQGEPRVLMGRRSASQIFLPNVFVFPGGRVDDEDAAAPSADELSEGEAALLALPRLGHAPYAADFVRSLPLAAVRETFEETGLAAGARSDAAATMAPAVGIWRRFLSCGALPKLSAMRFILRAVTPPGRPRRYDTRFFMIDAREIVHRGAATDDELSEVNWFGLRDLQSLDVPRITRVVICELDMLMREGLKPAEDRRIPFFFEQNDVMRRTELSLRPGRS